MLKGEKAELIAALEKSNLVDVDVYNEKISLSDKESTLRDKERTATGLRAVGGGSCLWAKRRDAFDANDTRKKFGESVEIQELHPVSNETVAGENPRHNSTISNGLEVLQY